MDVQIGGPATGPLSGVRVLDASNVVSGPIATQILGDLGAEIVKVESPNGGDTNRYIGTQKIKALSGLFVQLNRNKRSVVLDLKSEGGKHAFRKLASQCDVVFENYRMGVADRLGLGYEGLAPDNPGLVYVAITGYGPDGPYADQPAYDLVIQGVSGITKHGDKENPKPFPSLIADKVTGLTAAYATIAALYSRDHNGGRGQKVDVPMLDAFSAFAWTDAFHWRTYGEDPPPGAESTSGYQVFPTADGHVAILIIEDHHFKNMLRIIERDDLLEDESLVLLENRTRNRPKVHALYHAELPKFTTAEILKRARRLKVPLGPVHDVESFLEDPQVQVNQTAMRLEDRDGETMTLFGSPPRYSLTPPNVRKMPPRLGEHTAEILAEFGLSDEEIEAAS